MDTINDSVSNHPFFQKYLPNVVFDQRQEIKPEDVRVALEHATMRVHSKHDVLLFFSSLNLLNAAIKNSEFKEILSYKTIKGHATRVIGYCITAHQNKYLDDIFINKKENYCAYVRCAGLQFCFHNIGLSDTIRRFVESSDNVIKDWDNIRLQPIASSIFRKSIELKYGNRNHLS